MLDKMYRNLKTGRFYRISNDLFTIPQGTYRLEDNNDGWLDFSVGKKRDIHFLVMLADPALFQEVSFHVGKKNLTKSAHFVTRYYELLEQTKTLKKNASPIISMCLIPEKYLSLASIGQMQKFGPSLFLQ